MGAEKGYATADLFIPHPTVPGFWKMCVPHSDLSMNQLIDPISSVGRKDDVIIHTSGEKTVPAPMENIVSNSP